MMKPLQTAAFIVAGLLAGTACQAIPPKPENVSVEPGSLANTATRAGIDSPAVPQLDPVVRRLKGQLSLTEPQTQKLDKIFKETRIKREALKKELQDIYIKRQERINAVLTPEQLEELKEQEQEHSKDEPPKHPAQLEQSEP